MGVREGTQAGRRSFFANLSSFALDFALRQKVQGQNLNWFIVGRQPSSPPSASKSRCPPHSPKPCAAQLMNGHHLHPHGGRLCHSPSAGPDLHRPGTWPRLPATGVWTPKGPCCRLLCGTRPSAAPVWPRWMLLFYLYGLDAHDAAYIMNTFPIVREHDEKSLRQFSHPNRCTRPIGPAVTPSSHAVPPSEPPTRRSFCLLQARLAQGASPGVRFGVSVSGHSGHQLTRFPTSLNVGCCT